MKVYVVERGWYSDKYIVGIVETEEEAEKICEIINSNSKKYYNDARYEEYDTEQFKTHKLRWVVNYSDQEWNARVYDCYFMSESYESREVFDGHYVIYADDKSTAIKIAQDIRAEKIAEKEGVKM